jgi:hypothetical protein
MEYARLHFYCREFAKLAAEEPKRFEPVLMEALEQSEGEPLAEWDDPTATILDEPNEPMMSHSKAFEEVKRRLGNFALKEFIEHYGDLEYYDPKDVAYFINYYWVEFD